ncbi:hypothetical protein WICMUC_003838 [Wickerhamomyces mucosus]|uniref:MI domain-containing protein n=1 Tax=Wickerhamomyces mucosus TaxID=1378264 RepID=A0A9P8TC98_9ASCO|nr:hypothetical protein WICMUC_003838 [Wickerhamomyces mucosus]
MKRGRKDNKEERHGIRIPGSLLDELKTTIREYDRVLLNIKFSTAHTNSSNSPADEDGSRFDFNKDIYDSKKRKISVSRKDKRKQEREAKKQKKVQGHQLQESRRQTSSNKHHLMGGNLNDSSKLSNGKRQVKFNSIDQIKHFDKNEILGFNLNNDISSMNGSEEDMGSSDDYDDFDDKNFDEGDFDDFDNSDNEDEPQTAEDTMKALMLLKAKKSSTSKHKQPTTVEETMALLKAKKEGKASKESNLFEKEIIKSIKEPKAKEKKPRKESQKNREQKRFLSPEDEALLKRDQDDINYYAKKLGMKSSSMKDLKNEGDGLDNLLEGLDFLDNYSSDNAEKYDYSSEERETEIGASNKLLKYSKKPSNEKETMESLLKAAKAKKEITQQTKESKKSKQSAKYLTPEDESLMKRDEDDIKYYAKKLGLKGYKIKDMKNEGDGLDDLLEGLDFLDSYGSYSDEEESVENSEGYQENLTEETAEGDTDDDDEEDDDDDEDEDATKENDEEMIENPFSSDDEINSSDFDSDIDEADLEDDAQEHGETIMAAPKENPYVAPATAGKKYIPPALRAKLESNDSEELLKIKKSIKGPLNKLSEANIMTIVSEINSSYSNNPRQLVTEALTDVVLASIIQQGVLLDTFVIQHAALIGAIYRLQGVEVGAFFIQKLVEKYEEFYKVSGSKGSSNLISLLTACYSFQVISCKLLYNIISVLIEDITETNSELLLRIVKNAGQQMRNDDPSALKEIIIALKKNVAGKETNARTKFLVETITNLKNNKSKLHNELASQLITRMKKLLGSINNDKFHEPLQVSLDDIHNIDKKGKWWLVGSAWRNNLVNSNDSNLGLQAQEGLVDEKELNDILDSAEPNWMELARSQRMNTDVRRAIFISIMSSNDYIEAFTKLDKLRLKRSQEREIPKILLHCASTEKIYNPYYGLLANKLCSSHSLRKTFQFAFWDLLKEVEGDDGNDDEENSDDEGDDFFKTLHKDLAGEDDDFQLQKIVNLGKFFGNLIAEGSLPLHSLKNVNFVSLNSATTLFLEVLLIHLLDSIGKKSEISAFGQGSKKSKAEDLKFQDNLLIDRLAKCQGQRSMLRGLQYFLQEKVRASDIITGRKQRKRVEWGVDSTCDIVDEFIRNGDEL